MSSDTSKASIDLSESSSLSYQLTHSSVQPFEPKIDTLIDLNGSVIEKYVCNQCMDTFLFESSLKNHLERKSIKITYFCDKCNQSLNFYNRCALLSHIRSHNEKTNDKLKVSQVFVSPLPLTQLLPEGVAVDQTLVFKNINSNNNSENNCSNARKCVIPVETNSNHTIGANNVTQVKQNNMMNEIKKTNDCNQVIKNKILIRKSNNCENKCNECETTFSSIANRDQHFVHNIDMNLPSNQCKLCPIICPTKCNQSIHNRLHLSSNSKACPECGLELNQSNEFDFRKHIILNCLHFSRRLVYECIFCSNKMSSLSSFIQHIKSFHTTQYFQCSQCLLNYDTDLKLKEHLTNSHPNDMRRNIILKCPICETQVKSIKLYFDHISNHQRNCRFAKFKFVCYSCNQSFINKNDLRVHLNEFHTQNKTESDKVEFFDKLIKDISNQFKLNDCKFQTNNTLNNTKTDSNRSIVMTCSEKRNICESNGDKLNLNGERPVKRISTDSKLSTDKPIEVQTEADNCEDHSSGDKKANNCKSFKCKECGLTLPAIQTLKRHLILEHRIHDVETYLTKVNIEVPVVITEPQLPKEVGEQMLSQILEDQQSTDTMCPICSQTFSDSKELKIHGRVHGMAFIKSCQKKVT